MALSVIKLYDKGFFSQLGNEYVCTGFMHDMMITEVPSFADQLSSWNIAGVISTEAAVIPEVPQVMPSITVAANGAPVVKPFGADPMGTQSNVKGF